jgi:hypothetical protein
MDPDHRDHAEKINPVGATDQDSLASKSGLAESREPMKFPQVVKIACLSCAMMLPAATQAQFNFSTNNNTLAVTSYTGSGGVVIIPAITNGLSVVAVAPAAFGTKSLITSVTIPDSVTTIGFNAFLLCKGLTNVVLGTNLTFIGSEAFDNCTNLPTISIPNSVIEIDSNAFLGCINLTNAVIGSGLAILGGETFDACTNLVAITVDAGNPAFSSLGGVLFNKNQTLLIQYPPSKAGSSYTIPSSVTDIGILAFDTGFRLSALTIPVGVLTIGTSAFNKCAGVISFTIPDTVASIGDQAFNGCGGLTSVALPASVTNIGSFPFIGCLNLTNIAVAPANPAYTGIEGVLFDKNVTRIIQFPEAKSGNYSVPNSVKNIGDETFDACYNLTSVIIGNSVTNIGTGGFIGDYGLTNVTIPNSVGSIGQVAFYSCTNLTSLTIPGSVTNISDFAFYNCTNLTSVYFGGNAPTVGTLIFLFDNVTLYYLPGMTGWGASFAGVPAVLWNARAQTTDAAFGVRTNRFGFNITGTSGIMIVVEANTNLSGSGWQPLQALTLSGGTAYFSDAQWANYPTRLYRIRSP